MTILSEAFKNAYAIFFNSKKIPLFKTLIVNLNLTEADIYKATFDDTIAMLVIPNNEDSKTIERALFEQSKGGDGEGFWGQTEIGYKGKRWEKM